MRRGLVYIATVFGVMFGSGCGAEDRVSSNANLVGTWQCLSKTVSDDGCVEEVVSTEEYQLDGTASSREKVKLCNEDGTAIEVVSNSRIEYELAGNKLVLTAKSISVSSFKVDGDEVFGIDAETDEAITQELSSMMGITVATDVIALTPDKLVTEYEGDVSRCVR